MILLPPSAESDAALAVVELVIIVTVVSDNHCLPQQVDSESVCHTVELTWKDTTPTVPNDYLLASPLVHSNY